MWEVKSKKTGKIEILNDTELKNLKSLGFEKRFIITEIKPMRQIISPLKEPEKKIIKAEKQNK
jgi:hypothetical protein